MNRRRFVSTGIAAATMVAAFRQETLAQSPIAVKVELPSNPGVVMPLDFLGLSYESGQLYNAEYFSPRNAPLIKAFQGLGEHGVLRLGGHLSNITPWEGVGLDDPKQVRGVRHGIEDYWEWPLVDPAVQKHKNGIISRAAIQNLRGFLDAVNWRLMYGLNFACGSAARAADEASFVSRVMGDKLLAFVVGNEVDGFGDDPFFRAKGYDFHQYFAEYKEWVRTIREKVPHAPFAGPDTDGKVDTWVKEFARGTKGDAVLLTSHFYGMGPASDPRMTAERLLKKDHPDLDAQIVAVHEASALAGGTPYRMDEGNSCFGGGRPGVSDAYASALWAADYILHIACAGFAGVNLHGGGIGFYAPIESSEKSPAAPRPVYFGIQFARPFVGFAVSKCVLKTDANATAYVGVRGGQIKLAVVNKGAQPLHLDLPMKLRSKQLQRWELSAPALTSKEDITLAMRKMTPATQIEVPAYTAIILEAG